MIERGTHAQLMKKKGAYAALVAAQTDDVRRVERTISQPPIVLLSNMSSDDEEDCVW